MAVPKRVDPSLFPALAQYLASLPRGLASYPEAKSMGILLRSAAAARYYHPSWSDLPEELRDALRTPPPATRWVATVLTDAVFCAVADTFYKTREEVRRWNYERTLQLSRVPMYTTITKAFGIERFLATAERAHGLFQRGTDLRIEPLSDGAEVQLEHPPYLHGELNHFSNEGVFEAALQSAGAKDARVSLLESGPSSARYKAAFKRR